ncbi:terminase large subunit protein [uncultured Mediterranean phage uvMED]|nr:terminase large subunit protein [uncultured Mediterranean phage uvMED]
MTQEATVVFQKTYNAIKDGYNVIIGEGSSRSSKTWSYFLVIDVYFDENPRSKAFALRDTKTACYDILEGDFIEFLHHYGIYNKYERNKSKHTYEHPNGSVLQFSGADNVDNIIGKGNDIVWVNEPYSFQYEVLNQLMQRTTITIIDWNPKQDHYISGVNIGERRVCLKDRDNAKTIYSTFRDNPFCPEKQKQHILSYMPLISKYIEGVDEYERGLALEDSYDKLFNGFKKITEIQDAYKEIESLQLTKYQTEEVKRAWNNERQGTASKWHWEVYGLGIKSEAENRIYTGFKEICLEKYRSLDLTEYFGNDFGEHDPNALVGVKYYDGKLYVNPMVYIPERKMTGIDGIRIPLPTYLINNSTLRAGNHTVMICDSQDHDTVSEEGKIDILRRAGINAEKVNKPSRAEGIALLQRLEVYFVKNDKFADEVDRYSTMQEVRKGVVKVIPDNKTPHHYLDALKYIAYYLYEQGLMKHIDAGTIK